MYGAIAAAALVLLLGRWSAALYTDFLWFDALGAAEVWRARFITTALIEGGSFCVAALFAFLNLWAVRQSVVSLVLPRRIANIEIGEEVPGRYLLYAVLVMSGIVGVALLLPTETWSEALLAAIGQPFGEADPYFGADLGFYVTWLPFETTLFYWAMTLLVLIAGLVVLLYALTPSLRWERSRLYVSAYVRRHFIVLGGVLLLMLSWSYRLGMYRLLAEGGGTGGVFTAVDHRVLVPALLLLAVVSLCAAVVVAWAGWTGQTRIAFLAVGTVLVVGLAGRTIAPLLARRAENPSESAMRERAYLATRYGYTRRAYGVDRIHPESLGTGFSTAREAATRVAVWDGAALAHASQRLRRVRVVGEGAGWQRSDSGLAALLVERSNDGAAEARDVWGIRRVDPTTADDRGMPVREARASADELVLPEPAVYDSAPAYSVLSDSLRRFAGVEMVSTRSRLAHAWSLQNFRLLFGDLPLDRPTMVRHRDVRDRVHELAPFFVQGAEVLPLVAQDTLYWVLELYAASSAYPLSQRFTLLGEERGYLQHAVTALVNAGSGRVQLIVAVSPETVTLSWMRQFPALFVLPRALSHAVRDALPPIVDGARAQALAFAAAGFRGDSLEVRHFATPDGADSASAREAVRAVLPGLGVSALWPLLDGRERVRGVIASVGGAQRGTSWIPVASDDVRWGLALDRLRAPDSSLHESAVVHGPARVLPVAGRPLYLQSAVQWRTGDSPALVRVAVLVGDSVHAGRSFADALGVPSAPASTAAVPGDLRLVAASLHRNMRAALGRGDWAAFGRAFDSLGALLRTPAR